MQAENRPCKKKKRRKKQKGTVLQEKLQKSSRKAQKREKNTCQKGAKGKNQEKNLQKPTQTVFPFKKSVPKSPEQVRQSARSRKKQKKRDPKYRAINKKRDTSLNAGRKNQKRKQKEGKNRSDLFRQSNRRGNIGKAIYIRPWSGTGKRKLRRSAKRLQKSKNALILWSITQNRIKNTSKYHFYPYDRLKTPQKRWSGRNLMWIDAVLQ